MSSETNVGRSLREMELEVLEEGREWMRRRLEQKLQEEAARQGGVFPPQRSKGTAPAPAADEAADHGRLREASGVARSGPPG
jgi:hypothetical protein